MQTTKVTRFRIRVGVTAKELSEADKGTVERDERFGDAYMVHQVDGVHLQDENLDACEATTKDQMGHRQSNSSMGKAGLHASPR